MDNFAKLALEEYNSSDRTVRRAGSGKPFWNINSSQFMFVPQFEFPEIPGARAYLFTATDSKGATHAFECKSPIEPLTPIWKDIAPGFVSLKVEAIHRRGDEKILAGARTFWKCDPFPGRTSLPPDGFFHSPAALEQYEWYVPIDGSTGAVIRAMLDLYSVTKNPLLLEKACALGDSVTRMQDPESGVIPTHWMSKEPAKDLYNFWINCHIGAATNMLYLANALGES